MEAKLVKTNYTAPQPEVLLLRGSDGYLQVSSDPSATAPKFIQEKLDLLAMLRVLQAAPKGITARQLETRYGGVTKALKVSERALRELLAIGRRDGLLEGAARQPLELTQKAENMLQNQSSNEPDAARRAPRGNATRRKKP